MIMLTRLNGEELHINAMQIESVDSSPDTRVTMVNGRQLYVRESIDGVRTAMIAWFRTIHAPPVENERDC